MTGAELAQKIISKVQEPSLTESDVLEIVTDELEALAERILLPGLITSGSVQTDIADDRVDLPSDYHRGLFRADYDDDEKEVTVYANERLLLVDFPAKRLYTGSVYGVCVADAGDKLVYRYVPSEQKTIRLRYYKQPGTVTSGDQLPAAVGNTRVIIEKYLLHRGCAVIWDGLEDGVDGQKVNTSFHTGRAEFYLEVLDVRINKGVSHKAPPIVRCNF